eukprot:gene18044-19853_t
MEIEKLRFKLKSLSNQHQEDIQEKIQDVQQEIKSFSKEQKEVIDKIRNSVTLSDEKAFVPVNGELSASDFKKFSVPVKRQPELTVPIKVPDFQLWYNRNIDEIEGKIKKNAKKEITTIKKNKRPNSPEQDNFLEKLGLVSQEKFAEMKFKQQDRKRRTRSVPSYLLLFSTDNEKGEGSSGESSELELIGRELNNKKKRDKAPKCNWLPVRKKKKKEESQEILPLASSIITTTEGADIHDFHELICSTCHDAGNLLMCDTCDRVYHLTCLRPSLPRVPPGMWFCPKCVERLKDIAIPDVDKLKTDQDALETFKTDLKDRRKLALAAALEIRRQRHNYGVQIKQFTSSYSKKKVSVLSKLQKPIGENTKEIKKDIMIILIKAEVYRRTRQFKEEDMSWHN